MRGLKLIALGLLSVALIGCSKESAQVEGKGGKKLELTGPSKTDVTQGETAKITIKVDRKEFKGPVDLEVSQLPEGITVLENEKRIVEGKDSVELTLKATPEAPPVAGHKAQVAAKAGEMKVGPIAFEIDVEKKN
ncbi:MAG: hypothetical protein AB7K24_32385 [Gemmataceae bacterium]